MKTANLTILSPLLLLLTTGCLTTLDLSGDYNSPADTPDLSPDPEDISSFDMQHDADMLPQPVDMGDMRINDMPDIAQPEDMSDMDIDMIPPDPGQGLIFSEVVEGRGFNKFVEIYNSSSSPIDLTHIWFVNVNLSSIDSDSVKIAPKLDLSGFSPLKPNEVILLCHVSRDTTEILPCDQEASHELNFNGDDPLALFLDVNQDGTINPDIDTLLDSFGQVNNTKPPMKVWENTTYQRCNPTPYLGEFFFEPTQFYTEKAEDTFDNLGTPPTVAQLTGCDS